MGNAILLESESHGDAINTETITIDSLPLKPIFQRFGTRKAKVKGIPRAINIIETSDMRMKFLSRKRKLGAKSISRAMI